MNGQRIFTVIDMVRMVSHQKAKSRKPQIQKYIKIPCVVCVYSDWTERKLCRRTAISIELIACLVLVPLRMSFCFRLRLCARLCPNLRGKSYACSHILTYSISLLSLASTVSFFPTHKMKRNFYCEFVTMATPMMTTTSPMEEITVSYSKFIASVSVSSDSPKWLHWNDSSISDTKLLKAYNLCTTCDERTQVAIAVDTHWLCSFVSTDLLYLVVRISSEYLISCWLEPIPICLKATHLPHHFSQYSMQKHFRQISIE